MDILIWVLSCSLFNDDLLVQAIINTQSSAYEYYVGDSSNTVEGVYPDNIKISKKVISKVIREGGRPLIGLMGIPSEVAAEYSRIPADLLDPCLNVSVGTAILAELAETCRRGPSFRYELVKKYGALLGYKDEYFANSVISNIKFLRMKSRRYQQMTGDDTNPHTKLLEQGKGLVEATEGWNTGGIFLDDRVNAESALPSDPQGQ